jgi:hypothetical protein
MWVAIGLSLMVAGVVGPREADRLRIQRHLAQVEHELRRADVDGLPPRLRDARGRHLDELHRYAARGVFPRNRLYAGRVPIFIDDEGNACAVGHLMIASGARATAEEIARTQNTARVPAIDHRAATGWIAASGLSIAEHTRIQPNYCPCEETYMPVCGVDGVSYANACTATECAGVEIAHEGICENAGDDAATDWPAPGTSSESTSSESTSSGTGDTTSSTTTSTTAGESGTSSSSSTSAATHSNDDGSAEHRGCGIGSRGAAALAILPLFARRRRRAR